MSLTPGNGVTLQSFFSRYVHAVANQRLAGGAADSQSEAKPPEKCMDLQAL
jgi:hypothetical protein